MTTNRVIVPLIMATVILQAVVLYRQFRPAVPLSRPAVADAPRGSVLTLNNLAVKGNSEATLVLLEFSDYECPYCARYATTVAPQLDQEFVTTGKLKYAFVNNPLPMHPNAKLLATAAICAGYQNRYWEMHDALFGKKPKTRSEIVSLSQDLTMDRTQFDRCLTAESEASNQIEKESAIARELKLTGTPSFALGWEDRQGDVHIQKFIYGAQPKEVFDKALKEALSKGRS